MNIWGWIFLVVCVVIAVGIFASPFVITWKIYWSNR